MRQMAAARVKEARRRRLAESKRGVPVRLAGVDVQELAGGKDLYAGAFCMPRAAGCASRQIESMLGSPLGGAGPGDEARRACFKVEHQRQ